MRFLVYNGPQQNAGIAAKIATGTSIKTMMQLKNTIQPFRIVGWGYSFDGSAAATPGIVELIEADVGATVTAYVEADFSKINNVADGGLAANAGFNFGTATSGYTATAEGSITSTRNLDAPQLVAPTSQVIFQAPLGFEALVQINKFARIRVQFPATVNMLCFMLLEI